MQIKDLVSDEYEYISELTDLGLDYKGAMVLSWLLHYWHHSDNMDKGFYKTYKEWRKDVPLTEYELKKALKVLKGKGYLSVKKKGQPAKNYYTLFIDKINADLKDLDE